MARRYRFGFVVLLVLGLLLVGMAAGWGDLIASDDVSPAGSDDLSASADLLSPSLALPVAFVFTAPLLVVWRRLVAQQPQVYTAALAPVLIPRAPPA